MGQFMFRAVITLDAAPGEGPVREYPSGTHAVMVRASLPGNAAEDKYFEAVIAREDGKPLRPGDDAVVATVTVFDDDAGEFLAGGQHFALWQGRDIGHGVVSRRVFASGSPS